jgi:hypothetical protein
MPQFSAGTQQILSYAGYGAVAFVVVLALILAVLKWRNRRI